jgi:hypothetical protein
MVPTADGAGVGKNTHHKDIKTQRCTEKNIFMFGAGSAKHKNSLPFVPLCALGVLVVSF